MNWKELTTSLLTWYDKNARILPWRSEPTPYRVWVSEIMLQQTRVEAVKPYFERFLSALPDMEALACVPEDTLFKLWEGLGYYNRARNLQRAAKTILSQFGGELPKDPVLLQRLSGIGEYTAGAIASIAYGVPVCAVDGNVLRVLSRVCASYANISDPAVKKGFTEQLNANLPQNRPGDFNQALMEIGAVVCLPNGKPKCKNCPLAELCEARRRNLTEELPVKAAKKPRTVQYPTVFVLSCGGYVAIHRRNGKGLLAGLYEFPMASEPLSPEQAKAYLQETCGVKTIAALPPHKHIFTHIEWRMTAYRAEVSEPNPEFLWVTKGELQEHYALPNAFKLYAELLQKEVLAHG